MDISMDIHEKSVDMDMDMDAIFHIHANPGYAPYEWDNNEIIYGNARNLQDKTSRTGQTPKPYKVKPN